MRLFPLLQEHNKYNNSYGTIPLQGKTPKYHVANKYKPFLAIIDFLGAVIFFFNRLRKQPDNPKKILLIRLDHLGDIIMTLPTYAAIRRLYPEAQIHTLVRSFTQDVFYNNKNIDKVILFDPPWFARDKKISFSDTIRFLLKLRKEKYDLIIELHADPRNILAATFIGGYKVGYGIRGLGFLFNKIVNYPQFNHLVEINLNIIRALGYKEKTLLNALTLQYGQADEMAVRKYIKTPFVIINPGTGRPNKYWMPERWAKVADILAKQGYSIILTGSKTDISECKKITNLMKQKAILLAGKTTIRQLFVLIKKAKLVLAPDTSIAHFCACLGIPSITLFGPIPSAICSYESRIHKVIVKTLPCSYCAQPICPRTDNPDECMRLISAEEVAQLAQQMLTSF